MKLDSKNKNILTKIYSRKGAGCPVEDLVSTFRAAGATVEQDGSNYTFSYRRHNPLTLSLSKTKTPPMSKLAKKLSEIAGSILADQDPDFALPKYAKERKKPRIQEVLSR